MKLIHKTSNYTTGNEILIEEFIMAGLKEDVGEGDHTSLACIPVDGISKAKLLIKDHGILAGVELAKHIFHYMDENFTFEQVLNDGDKVNSGDIAFYITCNSQDLLKVERLCLNIMQRMSGIATMCNAYVQAIEGTGVTILDTRKTTPLLRFFEKWAVQIGGCQNYRIGLYDRIIIKDNHIDACGGIIEAIHEVQHYLNRNNFHLGITVEVRSFEELEKVLSAGGINQIMLDNFSLADTKKAVQLIDKSYKVEASGGITLKTIRKVANTGVDYISVGALTHSFKSLDLSLKIMKLLFRAC